jgi:hypothetical protein
MTKNWPPRSQTKSGRLNRRNRQVPELRNFGAACHPQKRAYNVAMRHWLIQPVLLGIACLFTAQAAYAQNTDLGATSKEQAHAHRLCPPSHSDREQSAGPEISIAEVTFLGTLQMPASDREQIAASLKKLTGPGPLDGVVDDALERVRGAWQDRGYFTVQVTGNGTTLTSSPVNQRISLSVYVDEGKQYRLGSIRFKNNKAIRDVGALRALFPMADGDVFSREEIAKGLENLRRTYGELGYLNFTLVPDTKVDDGKSLIDIEIDVDEGKRFYVEGVDAVGLDEGIRQELLKDFPLKRGQIYNSRHYDLFLLKEGSILSACGSERRLNERVGTITITIDCRPCPAD